MTTFLLVLVADRSTLPLFQMLKWSRYDAGVAKTRLFPSLGETVAKDRDHLSRNHRSCSVLAWHSRSALPLLRLCPPTPALRRIVRPIPVMSREGEISHPTPTNGLISGITRQL